MSIAAQSRLLVEASAADRRVLAKGSKDETGHCSQFDRQSDLDQPLRVFGKGIHQAGDEDHHTRRYDDDHDRKGSQEDRRTSAGRNAVNPESSDGRMLRTWDVPNASST